MARILVADDEMLIRKVIRQGLELGGHSVCEAADGQACLAALAAGGIDLVILDVFMPGPGGLEVLASLKEAIHPPPSIVISGGGKIAGVEVTDLARRLGAGKVLFKPFGLDALTDAIGTLLSAPSHV